MILFLHTVLAVRASELRFRILSPMNNSIIGSATNFRSQLEEKAFNTDIFSPLSTPMKTAMTFTNDATGTNRRLPHLYLSVFDCFLSQSIFLPGLNVITVSLYAADDPITLLHTEKLHLFSQKISPYDSHFDSLIEYTRSKEFNELTYMFIGSRLNNQVDWSAFLTLDAGRIEYFYTSAVHDSAGDLSTFNNLCDALSGSGPITHCFADLRSLHNVIFVDTSFICLKSLVNIFDSSYSVSNGTLSGGTYDYFEGSLLVSECESTNSGECYRSRDDNLVLYLERQILQVMHLTRKIMVLFVPVHGGFDIVFTKLLQRLSNKSLNFEMFLSPDNKHDSQKNNEILPNTTAWLLHVTLGPDYEDGPRPRSVDRFHASDTSDVKSDKIIIEGDNSVNLDGLYSGASNSDESLSSGKDNGEQMRNQVTSGHLLDSDLSSMMMENYDAARAFMLIKNACVQRDLSVVLFRNASSGIGIVNMTHLNGLEDRGFLYTQLHVEELPANSIEAARVRSEWPLVKGMSAYTHSVQENHLCHELEHLTQLLYAATVAGQSKTRRPVSDSGSYKVKNEVDRDGTLESKYTFLAQHLTRVFLGKLDPYKAGDWILSAVGFVAGFCEAQMNSVDGNPLTSSARYDWVAPPSIHTKADLYNVMSPSTMSASSVSADGIETRRKLSGGVCFEELLVLGRANSHFAFYGDPLIAKAFKSHVYSNLGISGTDVRGPLLRVTVVLRAGPYRMFTNFPAMREMLINSGNVDPDWLDSHTVVVDLMSFKEQVELAASSDVILTVHGAAIGNAIFMREGSVVIDIFNARFVEFFLEPMLRESGVKYLPIFVLKQDEKVTDCLPFPPHCLEGTVHEGVSLQCLGLRCCSIEVNLEALHCSIVQAYHHVISLDMSRR